MHKLISPLKALISFSESASTQGHMLLTMHELHTDPRRVTFYVSASNAEGQTLDAQGRDCTISIRGKEHRFSSYIYIVLDTDRRYQYEGRTEGWTTKALEYIMSLIYPVAEDLFINHVNAWSDIASGKIKDASSRTATAKEYLDGCLLYENALRYYEERGVEIIDARKPANSLGYYKTKEGSSFVDENTSLHAALKALPVGTAFFVDDILMGYKTVELKGNSLDYHYCTHNGAFNFTKYVGRMWNRISFYHP